MHKKKKENLKRETDDDKWCRSFSRRRRQNQRHEQDLNFGFGFNMKKTNKLNTNAKTMTRAVERIKEWRKEKREREKR